MEIIARYRLMPTLLVYGGLSLLSALLIVSVFEPTAYMQARPIFGALVALGALGSLAFVWKLAEILIQILMRGGAAVYARDGVLHTLSGRVALADIVNASVIVASRPWVQIVLRSGRRQRFGADILDEEPESIAERIRAMCRID